MFLKAVGGIGALGTIGIGGAMAQSGARQGARPGPTIVDIASEADDFNVLVAAVVEAGLVDTLSGRRQFTVFAPTDEAFGELLDELGLNEEELLASPDLVDILLYHVTNGRRYSESVVNSPRLRMLNGGYVDVDGTELNETQANIVGTDIEASNGVIHVIDGVLLP